MILLVAALIVGGAGLANPAKSPSDPMTGGYEPIITLPPPSRPAPGTPRPTTRTVPGAVVYTKSFSMGSAGEFPGSVYRVHYRLDVLVWNTAQSKWDPCPSTQYTRTSNLNTPIVVTWNEASQGSEVAHGVTGSLTFTNLSQKKIRLEFYWIPGGDAWTPPDPESDYMEFTVP